MARKKAVKKKPAVQKETRTTKREMASRVQFTLDLMHRFTYVGDVQQRVCQKYKITARQAREYIRKARNQYVADIGPIDKDQERIRLYTQLEAIADDRKLSPADKSARTRAIKIQIGLMGLAAPAQFEVINAKPLFDTDELAQRLANPRARKLAQELDEEIARESIPAKPPRTNDGA